MQFAPNISHAERSAAEQEAREFYAKQYPHVDYKGIIGFNGNSTVVESRWNQSFYFPVHYMEPVEGNEAAVELDIHSSEPRIRAVDALFELEQPSLTDRLSLVKEKGQVSRCGNHDGPSYGVVLLHPGVPLSDALLSTEEQTQLKNTDDARWPKDFASMVVCIPDLLVRSTRDKRRDIVTYIHDLSHPQSNAVFMGGALINHKSKDSLVEGEDHSIYFVDEISLEELESRLKCGTNTHGCYQETIPVANREWTITVEDREDGNTTTKVLILLGGFIIIFASTLLAVWVKTSDRRTQKFNKMKSQADIEKAALILQNARQAAKTERELNDFIAQ
jgi:hypothetical protein